MLPDCLKNLIGIKCLDGSTKPISGYFINDLEGMSLKYAANITDEQRSGLVFMRDKIAFATGLVLSELSMYLEPYFRLASIIDELRVGDFASSFLPVAGVSVFRGVKIKTRSSRLLRIRIPQVNIETATPDTDGSLRIYDGLDYYDFAFTTDSVGLAVVYPEYTSKGSEILISVDNDIFSMNNSKVKDSCSCSNKVSSYLQATGWNGTSAANSTYGLQVQAIAECSVEDMGCILGSKLALPVLYRSGLEIVKEAKTTTRLNSITILGDDKAEFLFDEFGKQYDLQMKNLIRSIPQLMARIDDCCVSCSQSRYIEGAP